jgi:hypothetical protein
MVSLKLKEMDVDKNEGIEEREGLNIRGVRDRGFR